MKSCKTADHRTVCVVGRRSARGPSLEIRAYVVLGQATSPSHVYIDQSIHRYL